MADKRFDERAYVARVEAADADEFARLIAQPSREEEDALIAYLGEDRYARMQERALNRNVRRAAAPITGNVVVLHGIMGGELTVNATDGDATRVWMEILRLLSGGITRLELAPDGLADAVTGTTVGASGILKRTYGELLLDLAAEWRVRAFWYDWRKDLSLAADSLRAHVSNWFEPEAPVHLVAHSMGGLVARTFALRHADRWATMWDAEGNGKKGGRLVMLGTPNRGSYDIPQVMTGLDATVRKLAKADLLHSRERVVQVVNSFPGVYQMLPASETRLYDAATWAPHGVSQKHLDAASKHHAEIGNVVDPKRMVYVAGFNQPTFASLTAAGELDQKDSYTVTLDGDGRVTHALGKLDGVHTYFVDAKHGDLPQTTSVLDALGDLLRTGETTVLPETKPARDTRGADDPRKLMEQQDEKEDQLLDDLLRRLATRERPARGRSARTVADDELQPVTTSEREAEELMTRDFLGSAPTRTRSTAVTSIAPPSIAVALAHGVIEDTPGADCIAVGHYVSVKPQAAELSLDKSISNALPKPTPQTGAGPGGVLERFTLRGTLVGHLGTPFFLPDPRDPKRLIAIAGLGLPGRFGEGELTVVARELCWALAQIGRRRLATVVIGAGTGNLDVAQAIAAWMRGIAEALAEAASGGPRLEQITFVEFDPERAMRVDEALRDARDKGAELEAEYARLGRGPRARLVIDYKSLTPANLEKPRKDAQTERRRRFQKEWELQRDKATAREEPAPTRVTLGLEGRTYRFGAITQTAAVPERDVPVDPVLVMEANDDLAAVADPESQLRQGRFLSKLLLPDELRNGLAGTAPLVMLLDATTARIHWELVSDPTAPPSRTTEQIDESSECLAIRRGFTRQLRTTFALPPDPPPPPQRLLRVLVVADPAEDRHLPGAAEEGVAVAKIFERLGHTGGADVEVVTLLGPRMARRTAVLQKLLLERFHVMHYAGHCQYLEDDPAKTGWLFSDGEVLSASELRRIDRVPDFIFSNACESGVTPDRSDRRSPGMAPTFAESFFERGVKNFVCTAWPVDDVAAQTFAKTLYGGLLGLPEEKSRAQPRAPLTMHRAMLDARLAIASTIGGARTWGAYQHYGDPYYRLLA